MSVLPLDAALLWAAANALAATLYDRGDVPVGTNWRALLAAPWYAAWRRGYLARTRTTTEENER